MRRQHPEEGVALTSLMAWNVRGPRNPDLRSEHRLAALLAGAASPWRALCANGCTLAGAPTWPLWPGGRCYVQGESLKARRPSLRRVSSSRLPV